MERENKFANCIHNLENSLSEVRTVWMDQTAFTYDAINDNMKSFTDKIWLTFCESTASYNDMKKAYNEEEEENILREMGCMVRSV